MIEEAGYRREQAETVPPLLATAGQLSLNLSASPAVFIDPENQQSELLWDSRSYTIPFTKQVFCLVFPLSSLVSCSLPKKM